MPSMETASMIMDVRARHEYVFDNGLTHPDLFDVEKRIGSEEFQELLKYAYPDHRILEIGCLTGLNLIGLADHGYNRLTGIDFVSGAIRWLRDRAAERNLPIESRIMDAMDMNHAYLGKFDRIIAFDVLEHQLDIKGFLNAVRMNLDRSGELILLVPEGTYYNDCGHVAWFPNESCLVNVLSYFFHVIEIRTLECHKIFTRCKTL